MDEHVHYSAQGKNTACNTGAWNILYSDRKNEATCPKCVNRILGTSSEAQR